MSRHGEAWRGLERSGLAGYDWFVVAGLCSATRGRQLYAWRRWTLHGEAGEAKLCMAGHGNPWCGRHVIAGTRGAGHAGARLRVDWRGRQRVPTHGSAWQPAAGMAWRLVAGQRGARLGRQPAAWQASASQGEAWRGRRRYPLQGLAVRGAAWQARRRSAAPGVVRQARLRRAVFRSAWLGYAGLATRGLALQGESRQASHGKSWKGNAPLGMAGASTHGYDPSGLPWQAWPRMAARQPAVHRRPGGAWRDKQRLGEAGQALRGMARKVTVRRGVAGTAMRNPPRPGL